MAAGANAPPPTVSCDQLNSAGQDHNDESMALPDEEHRESGNESDVAPSLNQEEEPGDGLTGKTSVDLLIFFCKDSLDFKEMALVFRRSFKSVNDQMYSSLIRFLVSHGLSGHYEL